jgi:hypothetical protein
MEILVSYNGYISSEDRTAIQDAIGVQLGESNYALNGGKTKYKISKNVEGVVIYRGTNKDLQDQKIYVMLETFGTT